MAEDSVSRSEVPACLYCHDKITRELHPVRNDALLVCSGAILEQFRQGLMPCLDF
jgi:hypothetical protein